MIVKRDATHGECAVSIRTSAEPALFISCPLGWHTACQ